MRYIEKEAEPESLRQWKASANENWQPSWGNLQNPQKAELRRALAEEQGWTCCYCCASIDENDEGEWFHIEHLRPKSRPAFKHLAIDYGNLLVSCGHPSRQRASDALRCGEAKDDWFDEALFVSPLDPDCEERFSYNRRGEIAPAQSAEAFRNAATEMIRRLRLNDEILRRQRQEALDGFLGDLDALTDDDLRKLLDGLNERDNRGRLVPFSPALRAVIRRLLP